ncbi:hypothetical protein E8E11_004146 [Didymella keratinophila]|nr:hypothetical protein E8E11_004146 [Didymella keratinophila]
MLNNAMGTEPAMAQEERLAVQDNPSIERTWHLVQTPIEKRVEADRNAAVAAEEAAALRARFEITPAEVQKSEKEWREWLSKRSTLNFVSDWRDFVPTSTSNQDEVETIGEKRFGKVIVAQHDKCIICEAMETIRADPAVSHEEKVQRLRRLQHTVPKLQMSTVTEGAMGTRNVPAYGNLMNASTWGHESASSIREQTAVFKKGLFDGMSFRLENLESTIDIQEGHWKVSQNITKALVNSVGGDKEILDEVSNQERFEEHSKAVKQRVNLYKGNKDVVRSALTGHLDQDSIETAAKAKADAVELERDLAMLHSTLNAIRARYEQIRNGNGRSVLEFNKKFCEMRRYKWSAGLDMEDLWEGGIPYRPKLPDPVVESAKDDDSPFRVIQRMRDEYQDQRSLRGSPPPPGEGSPTSVTPPAEPVSPGRQSGHPMTPPSTTMPAESHIEEGSTPVVLTESPEDVIDGPSQFAKTMQEFNRHTREQVDNAAVSTDSNPFGLEDALNVVPTTHQAAGPSTEVATAATAKDKGMAKKDSQVNGLPQEDGISLKDFAPEVEQKKGRPLRKLSVKAGSSLRPKTDPSSRPAWKR